MLTQVKITEKFFQMKKSEKYLSYRILLFLSLSIFFTEYIITLSKHWNFDGVVFALFLREAFIKKNIFLNVHFQHLIYQPLLNFIYFLLPYKIDFLIFLQLFNTFLSILTLFIVFKILKIITNSKVLTFFGTLSLGFSFNFWYYATDSEVHMLSCFFVSIVVYYFFKGEEKRALFFSSLSIFSHILNTFLFVAFSMNFLIRKKIKEIAYSLIIPLTAYAIFFIYVFKAGMFNKYFGRNHVLFFVKGIGIKELFQNFNSYTNLFLRIKNIYLGSFIFVIFVFSVFLFYKKKKHKVKIYNFFTIFFIYFIFQFVFHLFWEPLNEELKSPIAIFMLIALIYGFKIIKREKGVILLLLVVIAFNSSYFVKRANISTNRDYRLALEIKEKTSRNSLILIGGGRDGFINGKAYIPYFSLRRVIALSDYPKKICSTDIKRLFKRIDIIKGSYSLYVLSDVFKCKDKFCNKNTYLMFKEQIFKNSYKKVKLEPDFYLFYMREAFK